MRNKGFFWAITIALALSCIWRLTFTKAAYDTEKDAEEYAQTKLDSLVQFEAPYFVRDGKDTLYMDSVKHVDALRDHFVSDYLKRVANQEVHFAGYTYADCKEREINLGLDLRGGMSATLEISVPALVNNLAGDTKNPDFRIPYEKAIQRKNEGDGEFIDLFAEEFAINNSKEGAMARIFHMHNPDDIAEDASNEEVVNFLKEKATGALDGVEIIIEKRVNSFGVAQPTITKQPGTNRIFVELPGVKDRETVRRRLQSTANLEFYEVYDNALDGITNRIATAEQALSEALFGEGAEETEDTDTTVNPLISENVVEGQEGELTETETETESNSLLETPEENDLLNTPQDDPTGLTEESTSDTASADQMSVEEQRKKFPITSYLSLNIMPREDGQVEVGGGSYIGLASVHDTALISSRLNHPVCREFFPDDLRFMWDAKEEENGGVKQGVVWLHAIKVPENGPWVNGEDIDNSYVSSEVPGEFAVIMRMTPSGTAKWADMTEANLNKQVAITMDNVVFTAPNVQTVMTDGVSSITGNFTLYEAKELSDLLNAGALPAPVVIVNEMTVGPSLGKDNVSSGLWSFAFALSLVLIYMIFYYAKAGIIADLALLINIFFLVGALASLGAILTLPGIAGIVLTIGMSVDANVLIFERIREELRIGKGVKGAVKDGFAKALSSILDANITTLLTGIVLATFGTGPIKGFATTLIIGIFTAFFAAVVITRLIIVTFLEKDKKVSFSSKLTENWFTKTAVPFVKKRKLFYLVSGGLILAGIISLTTRGLDLGVDFSGGRQYVVSFDSVEVNTDEMKSVLTPQFGGEIPNVKQVENSFTAMITTEYLITEGDTSTNRVVEKAMTDGISQLGTFELKSSNMIAPTISNDLKRNSFYAIGFSLIIIFLYILLRFRKWQFGLGALIAMAHDVLIVLSLFSIFWGVLPFSMEIDQAFIAAILTVVGYSINDTVVVFDRIREYLGIHKKKDQKEVINMALNSTLSRTVNTSISTFIVLLIIFLFGGEAIKGFTFALMIGIIVGTYSSLFIATPAVIDFTKKIRVDSNSDKEAE